MKVSERALAHRMLGCHDAAQLKAWRAEEDRLDGRRLAKKDQRGVDGLPLFDPDSVDTTGDLFKP